MADKSYEVLLFNALKNGQNPVKSVYDIWLELGNTGTPQDFIDSLKGSSAIPVTGTVIKVADWVAYEGIYKAVVNNKDIGASDVVNISFTGSSLQNAITSGVLGFTSSIDGGFEVYSNFKPIIDLTIDYAIITY